MKREWQRAQAKRRRALQTPAARRARSRSRSAYHRLGARAALQAMRSEAAQVTTQPAWQPPKLRDGEKVLAYTSSTTMLVDEPGMSSNVVVESSWPLVTENAQGALAPTDMTLEPLVSGGWSPANSPVENVIGQLLGAGVRLGTGASTLTLRPGGTENVAGVRSANKVFYANTAPDIDTIVEPTPNGVGINWTLRSPLASEQTSMTLDLPAGVTLRASGPTVDLVQGSMVVGSVSPPVAWDAQNTQVPVRYSVSGSTITVTTSHHGRDLAYPISVDPVVIYDQWGNRVTLDPGSASSVDPYKGPAWVFGTAAGYEPYFGQVKTADAMYISVAPTLPAGSAAWMLSRANAFITRADFPDVRFNATANLCMAAGLWNWASGNPTAETGYAGQAGGPSAGGMFGNCSGLGAGTYITACASGVCDYAQGTTGNSAGVQAWVAAPATGSNGWLWFTGAYLFWNDHDVPTLSVSSGLPPSTSWTANDHPTVSLHLRDNGLGIGTDSGNGDPRRLAGATYDVNPYEQTAETFTSQSPCSGALNSTCYADGDSSLQFGTLDQGSHTLHFYGRDILGHVGFLDKTIKIDSRAPVINTTGRLADLGRSTSGTEPSRSVSKAVHLTAIASDANPGVAVSGLSSFTVTATQPGHPTVTDVGGSTVLSDGSWKIDVDFYPSGWNQGPVTFTLRATDAAGNVSAPNSFTVNVARGDITTLIEGQKTAKRLVLQAEDLKTSAPASTVVFQYRTKTTAWQNIPASNLQAMDGNSISVNSFAVSSSTHRSPQVVYNVADQLTSGQVFVRGYFSSAAGDTTDDVLTGIDTTGLGTSDSMLDIDPGQVDELTGNFQLANTDVDIDSFKQQLGISRTYNSRPGPTIVGAPQPFGPGWTLGMPVNDDASVYTKVIDYNASTDPNMNFLGAAEVDTSDGRALPFEEHDADNGYWSLPALDHLSLQRQVNSLGQTTGFTLKDRETGQTLVFDQYSSSTPGEWKLGSVQEATSAVATTFRYGNGAAPRLTDIVAPSPVDCSGANLATVAGCRSLHLTWNAAWTRVTGIDFVAPGNGLAGNKVAVAAYTYNSDNRLSSAVDPRPGAPAATQYDYYTDGRLKTITPPGENAWTLNYTQGPGELSTVGRLSYVSRSQPVGTAGTPTTAKQVIFYNMPVRGSSAVYDMSANALAGWGQVDDIPTDATAIFRPDDVPGNPPVASDYATATFHYLDALGRLTNEVRPGGETTTTEHDAAGNITRELSAVNRATALTTGSTVAAHAARAQELSTVRTFGERTQGSGWRLLDEKGPLHSTRLATGTTVQARKHVVNSYDDSDPDSKSLNLPIKTVTSAYVAGTGDSDSRTTSKTYNSDGLVTSSTVDPGSGNLNLVTGTDWNSLGLVTNQRLPRSASNAAASTRHTIYYTAGANSEDNTTCGNKPAWANLPCKTLVGSAPTGTLPKPVGSVYEYDAYQHQTKKTDYVNSVLTRTTTDAYSGDRHTSHTVSGSTGDARPDVSYGYSSITGRLLTTSAGSPAKTITRVYNAAGQISSYTDTEGASTGTTTTAYDIVGRPTSITDPSGTRTIAYDPITGRTSSITEPQLGAIATTWDADGALSSELFPNANIKLTITSDETGTVTGRSYVKQSPCSTNCTAYSDVGVRSIHDQLMTETGTDKTRTYAYDPAGRLTSSTDAPGGTACVTKTYTYDSDSNRQSRKTYPAGSGGACSTSTTATTQTLTYDEADRINNSGYAYDQLGRITTVPAADAGGTNALTSTFYVDDRAHTLTQGGTTTTLDLDPEDRVRQRTVGAGTPTVSHYGDETDEPAWTTQGSTTIRDSEDADGDVVATVGPAGGGSSSWSVPTTSVLDNFNRADGGMGSNWSNLGPAAAAITSNQAKINGSSYGYAWWNANSYTGAGEVYMTVPTTGSTGDQLYLDIVAGWSTGTLNGYELSLTRGSTNDTIEFSKYASGSETSLGAAQTMSGHVASGDQVALTREAGGLLKAWRSASGSSTWTQIGTTVTNTAYFDAGQSWQIGWGASNSGYRVDDFGGGQSTAAASTGTKLKIADLHGDVVSEVPNTSGASASLLSPIDVFGAPTTTAGANLGLGYLGTKQRNTTLTSGTIEMGARLYQPTIGRFLQTDPIYGGSASLYDYANQDPANQDDLAGLAGGAMGHCTKGNKKYQPAKCKKNGYKPHDKPKDPHVTREGVCDAADLAAWLAPPAKIPWWISKAGGALGIATCDAL